jgi:hypothetical protein
MPKSLAKTAAGAAIRDLNCTELDQVAGGTWVLEIGPITILQYPRPPMGPPIIGPPAQLTGRPGLVTGGAIGDRLAKL